MNGLNPQSNQSEGIRISTDFLSRCLLFLTSVAICFPYIGLFYRPESDLQPPALVLAIIFLTINTPLVLRQKLTPLSWSVLFVLTSCAIYAWVKLMFEVDFTLRSVAYYLSLPLFFLLGLIMKKSSNWTPAFLFSVTLIWLVVALTQKFIDPTFGYSLLRAPRTMADRGVVSLAAEPSYYAIQALMLIILNWLVSPTHSTQNKRLSISSISEILLVFQIVFLAQSFFGILLLGVFIAIRFAIQRPLIFSAISSMILGLGALARPLLTDYLTTNFPGRRMPSLLARALNDPVDILLKDQSAGERATDMIISLQSVKFSTIIDPGSSATQWAQYTRENLPSFDFLNFSLGGPRIMSGIGTAFFELGTLGTVLAACFIIPMLNLSVKSTVVAISMTMILLTAVPLSLPLVGIILAYIVSSNYPRMSRRKSTG